MKKLALFLFLSVLPAFGVYPEVEVRLVENEVDITDLWEQINEFAEILKKNKLFRLVNTIRTTTFVEIPDEKVYLQNLLNFFENFKKTQGNKQINYFGQKTTISFVLEPVINKILREISPPIKAEAPPIKPEIFVEKEKEKVEVVTKEKTDITKALANIKKLLTETKKLIKHKTNRKKAYNHLKRAIIDAFEANLLIRFWPQLKKIEELLNNHGYVSKFWEIIKNKKEAHDIFIRARKKNNLTKKDLFTLEDALGKLKYRESWIWPRDGNLLRGTKYSTLQPIKTNNPNKKREVAEKYKIHLMPKNKKELTTIVEKIIQKLTTDKKLQEAIYQFKFQLINFHQPKEKIRKTLSPKGNVMPLMVIYAMGKDNAQYVLETAYRLFADLEGLGITPRFNRQITPLIYYAQGDGDDKKKYASHPKVESPYEKSFIHLKPDFEEPAQDYYLKNPAE